VDHVGLVHIALKGLAILCLALLECFVIAASYRHLLECVMRDTGVQETLHSLPHLILHALLGISVCREPLHLLLARHQLMAHLLEVML